jgi:hypothetical protein
MALVGGLLWLAFQGHVWARDLVAGVWPLFVLAAGTVAAIIVTDRHDIMGTSGISAGVAVLFMAWLGMVPEATAPTLGPWALVVMGAGIALSGLGPRARPVGEGLASGTDAGPLDTTREFEHCLNSQSREAMSGRQAAKAS